MTLIDAHIHCGHNDPDLFALLAELDLKFLNICVAHDSHGGWRDQADAYGQLAQQRPDRFAWCTSFDLPRLEDPTYLDQVLAGLDQDFAAGAVACKIWKNIGMEVKAADGDFLMVDDPLLAPILEHIAGAGYTLLTHIAEPLACWQPLNEQDPHYGYYSRNPQWHMYNKPEYPSHTRLMAARDHMVANHPNLRVVGAHLGSLEYDTAEVAARLDRYPNFAVDISARLADLAVQDSAKVRQFFIDYQDRILFGTDMVMHTPFAEMSAADKSAALNRLRDTYAVHRAYLEGSGPVQVRSYQTEGLNLPADVLTKVYRTNAEQWYPQMSN
ncbi:MAG: amidohydrolase family protein [Caldilineaceae bacterium]